MNDKTAKTAKVVRLKGLSDGLKLGIKQSCDSACRRMLKYCYDERFIADVVGVPLSYVKSLKKEIKYFWKIYNNKLFLVDINLNVDKNDRYKFVN